MMLIKTIIGLWIGIAIYTFFANQEWIQAIGFMYWSGIGAFANYLAFAMFKKDNQGETK